MSANFLSHETSPYLLQHQNNPVHWQAWGPEAFLAAKSMNKPILLSIGYTACHWCHVMAHESFENPAIAAIMNAHFICIKVDREERPDLDAIYQQSLGLLGQQGGWPLTMFLTPDAQPFWGGTYFPPENRWGRAGFPDVLRGVARTFTDDYDRVAQNVGVLTKGLVALSEGRGGAMVDTASLDTVCDRISRAIDRRYGGFNGAPKFPNCPMLDVLWRGYRRSGDLVARDGVLLTLEKLCQGGIYDHLGGGFSRYATDEQWLVPHFEKMLYDNAQLIELLTSAYQDTGNPLFRDRVDETVTWLLREMRGDGDGFTASLDADSDHEEGKFYVWSVAEIDEILGDDALIFKQAYDVTLGGNWEGKTILNRSSGPYPQSETVEQGLDQARRRLLAARGSRNRPERDDKILADWNGLVIAALAQAATIFERPTWLAAAIEAWDFVTKTMTVGSDRLAHSWCRGKAHPGILDDYASMAKAAIMLAEITHDPAYLAQAVRWAESVEKYFIDPTGGYYMTADDTESLITRTKTITDAAVPSGNGTYLTVLGQLYSRTGDTKYFDRAERLIRAFSGELSRNFFPLGAFLNGIDLLIDPVHIILVGDVTSDRMNAFLKAAYRVNLPNRVLETLRETSSLPVNHPAYGKDRLNADIVAYVCRGQTCSKPVTELSDFTALLVG